MGKRNKTGGGRTISNHTVTFDAAQAAEPKRLAFFERYLTVWVFLCMVVGVVFGKALPDVTAAMSRLEFLKGVKPLSRSCLHLERPLEAWHGRTMPRQVRIQYPGAPYHVMSRGNRRQDLFLDAVDRHFLKTLAEACQKSHWQVHAYCLMSLHLGTAGSASVCLLATAAKSPAGPAPRAALESGKNMQDRGLTPFYGSCWRSFANSCCF